MVLTLKWNLLLFEDAIVLSMPFTNIIHIFVAGFQIVNCKLCIDYFVGVVYCYIHLNCLL